MWVLTSALDAEMDILHVLHWNRAAPMQLLDALYSKLFVVLLKNLEDRFLFSGYNDMLKRGQHLIHVFCAWLGIKGFLLERFAGLEEVTDSLAPFHKHHSSARIQVAGLKGAGLDLACCIADNLPSCLFDHLPQ
jgi:hypothetical protein